MPEKFITFVVSVLAGIIADYIYEKLTGKKVATKRIKPAL